MKITIDSSTGKFAINGSITVDDKKVEELVGEGIANVLYRKAFAEARKAITPKDGKAKDVEFSAEASAKVLEEVKKALQPYGGVAVTVSEYIPNEAGETAGKQEANLRATLAGLGLDAEKVEKAVADWKAKNKADREAKKAEKKAE